MRRFIFSVRCAIAALLLLVLGGCATMDDNDIPWNSPQPWEGSPSIPGMQGN